MDPLTHLADLERRAERGGGDDRLKRQHDAGKLSARERIDLLFDPGTLRRSRQARHPPLPRLRHGRADRSRRRRHRRRRTGRGPPGLRLRAGLHRLRRFVVGNQRRQDRQDHGSGDEDGRAGRRAERLGGRAHPGRRALARRLRRHLPAKHARLRRHPANLGDHGARAPAAPSTRRRSPTSTSWSRARATCS